MDFWNSIRGACDTGTGVYCIGVPIWAAISNPEPWLTPVMMWGGFAILMLRGYLTVLEWWRGRK